MRDANQTTRRLLFCLAIAAVTAGAADALELADIVNDDVAEQVEATVTSTLEEQVAADAAEAVQQQVESTVEQQVAETVGGQVQETVEQQVVGSVTGQIESGVAQQIEDQVTDAVETGVGSVIEQDVGSLVEDEIENVVEGVLTEGVDTAGSLLDTVGEAGSTLGTVAAVTTTVTPTDKLATWVDGVDENGWPVERDVWVMLIEPRYIPRVERWGFTVKDQQPVEEFGLILLRLDVPRDRNLLEVAKQVAQDAPGTVVDYNHLYRGEASAEPAVPARCSTTYGTNAIGDGRGITLGLLDSALRTDHPVFADAHIVQHDFVRFAGTRPTQHGTAVASILVGQSEAMVGALPRAALLAASVFFEDPAGHAGAATSSLVEALAWMSRERVHVVNMSLTGPPNRLLETAVARATGDGTVVVAAVGNNGPSGDPLYPAAYPSVVGVTAVDACHEVFRHAGRGRHVTFAATGVHVNVAQPDGGYAYENGTSFAAPRVAAVIAKTLSTAPNTAVVEQLKLSALDLGDRGFDDVFGFGLIDAAR